MGKRVTVYDIANELNISPSTVSRVLNNSNLISNERSKEILKTAERLGYKKRVIKKHVNRAILNIYIFLPKPKHQFSHFFYNYSELMEAVQGGFGDVKLNFISRVNDNNIDFFKNKKSAHIDGCIFAFTEPGKNLVAVLNDKSIPFIELNRNTTSGSSIVFDIEDGVQQLTQKIISSGKTDINPCFIGLKHQKELALVRYNIAKEVFRKVDIEVSEHSFMEIDVANNIDSNIFSWIDHNKFNVIMTFNDLIAISLLQEGSSRGYLFPEDLILTGFDNSPIQKLLHKKIDTIELSVPVLGYRAGLWLKKWIIDREEVKINDIIPVSYIKGNTIN